MIKIKAAQFHGSFKVRDKIQHCVFSTFTEPTVVLLQPNKERIEQVEKLANWLFFHRMEQYINEVLVGVVGLVFQTIFCMYSVSFTCFTLSVYLEFRIL